MPLNDFAWGDNQLDPMAALQQIGLIDSLYWDRRDAAQAILNRAGGGSIREWRFQPESWPPSWGMYTQADTLGLIFTGTTNAQQMAGHLLGAVGFPLETQADCFTNAFFYMQYKTLWEPIKNALPRPLPARVLIAGHSYGGAMAHLVAWGEKQREGPGGLYDDNLFPEESVQLLTFGQPRTFTSGLFFSPFRYFRLVNGADLVPLVPPVNTGLILAPAAEIAVRIQTGKGPWAHYGDPWLTGAEGFWNRSQNNGDGANYNAARWFGASVTDHLTAAYTGSIIKWLTT